MLWLLRIPLLLLIMGYKFPDDPLASENQFNQPQNQKYISPVVHSSSL